MLCLDGIMLTFDFSQLFHLDGVQVLLNISFACWYLILSINPSEDNLLLEQYKSLFLS